MKKVVSFLKSRIIYVFLICMMIFFSFASSNFLTVRNLMNVIKQVSIYGIASVGMTYVILLGGIDLSIGSIISLVNIVAAYFMVNLGWNPVAAVILSLLISTAIGFMNGSIIAELHMPELIVTFASQTIFAGLAYIICGMPVFDAINTSIAALSTGGFSVIGESIYGYHSVAIELITIVLMILGQTNFMLHLSFFSGKFKKYFNHCETKFFAVLFVIFVSLMTFNLLQNGYTDNFWESLRVSLFQFVTCITTTGFVSVGDMSLLPPGFITIMVMMMLVGGDQESTGGGIKQYRIIVVLKGIYYSIRESIMNPRVICTHRIYRVGEKYSLSDDEIRSTSSYVLFYILLFFIGSFIFTMYGYTLQDSMYEFSSAISTVGLSLGITNYYAPKVILWTAIIGMFLGRMEIMVVFKAFLRVEKDIRNREYLR